MTDRQIKRLARERIGSNGGDCISFIVFLFAVIAFFVMCELTVFTFLQKYKMGWIFDVRLIFRNRMVMLFWLTKTLSEIIMLTPELILVRRLFVDVAVGGRISDTRQYISAHSFSYYGKALYSSFIHNLIKVFAAVPGFVSAYGVYYWGYVCSFDQLTSAGLFCLMICLGFTVVWIGAAAHYYISLALTPYIMALNPRTNVFDACDLSVKLMDGRHMRYIKFMASFIKFTPTILLVYPFFAIYPYFQVCYTMLMLEFLGDYGQDKMPGMIKRWRKYS